MHPLNSDVPTENLETLPRTWSNWCRLCAKDDIENNINFLYQNKEEQVEDENKKLTLQEALEKYFWVQSSLDDLMPKMLCSDCLSLVSSMINFNERVVRVQQMFLYMAETTITTAHDLSSIRLKFDVTEQERNHWFSKYFQSEVHYMDSKTKVLENPENSEQSCGDSKFKINIKQEQNGSFPTMVYDDYMEEDRLDTDLEQEEMLYDDKMDNNSQEDEEDPFNATERKKCKKFDYTSSEEEDKLDGDNDHLEDQNNLPESPLNIKAEHSKLLEPDKIDKTKKKKKRKKCKYSTNLECQKKKIPIKDFPVETTCKECGDNFTLYSAYREHMKLKHDHDMGDKHWQCPSCDKVLLSLFNLERHVRIHVPLEERKKIKCPECDNRYTLNAQLETHIKYKHKNEKPFICEECGLCLRTNSNLRQHMLIHTDLAPFECDVCKKKFKNNSRLKNHMDIHSPNKHICAICGLQLNSRATLNRHFLVHSDEMQHKCDYCGRAFKRAKALKNHLLLHTGLKPYSCDFCDRTFANGSNCRSHMKKMHPEELAALEASGNKTHTKNIPKLETLKAVTKAADNLTPVVTKFSGCFAFGKKPKATDSDIPKPIKSLQKPKKLPSLLNNSDKLAASLLSPSSTPLNLQNIPLVGSPPTTSPTCSSSTNNHNDLTNTPNAIPNFDNIYQHLMKQNHTDVQLKRTASHISQQQQSSSENASCVMPHHNSFFQNHNNLLNNSSTSLTPSHPSEDILPSPESHNGSITPLTHDDHSNASSVQGPYYGPIRSSLQPGNFI